MNYLWVALLFAFLVVSGCGEHEQNRQAACETVKSGPFSVVIQGRCELCSEHEAIVWVPASPSRIRVRELKVIELAEEGTRVEKGDVVAALDTGEIVQFIEKTEGELKVAKAALESTEKALNIERGRLETEIKKAEVAVAQKEIERQLAQLSPSHMDRLEAGLALKEANMTAAHKQDEVTSYEYLATKKVISPSELEQKRLDALDALEAAHDRELELQIVRLGPYPLNISRLTTAWQKEKFYLVQHQHNLTYKMAGLEAEVAKAKKKVYRPSKNLELACGFLEKMTMRAPMAGVVLYRRIWSESGREKIKKGMRVWRGQAILTIQQTSDMQAVVEIAESQISFVNVGQKAVVAIDSIDDRQFDAEVKEIASTAQNKEDTNFWETGTDEEQQKEVSQEKFFAVKVKPAQQDARCKPGFRGTVKITAREMTNVITVPGQAMFKDGGKTFVYMSHAGKSVAREVVTGVAFGDKVVIEQGLQAGEQVLLEEPTQRAGWPRDNKVLAAQGNIEIVGMARRGNLCQKLVETGFLEPQQALDIDATIRGELAEIVAEGTYVNKGDKVFTLTAATDADIEEIILQQQTLETEIAKQESELELAKKNQELEVKKTELDVEQVKFELDLLRQKPLAYEAKKAAIATQRAEFARQIAEQTLAISEALWQKQLVSEAELSQRKLQLETSKLLLSMSKIKEDILLKGPLPEEIKLLQEKLELENLKYAQTKKTAQSVIAQFVSAVRVGQARLAEQEYLLAIAREEAQKGIVCAPLAGTVRYVDDWNGKPDLGKECFAGQKLVTISDELHMAVKTKVNEVDRGVIRMEQLVTLRLPAFPHKTFTGRVTAVGQLALDRNEVMRRGRKFSGVKVFEVMIAINESDPALKSGMSATAEIVVGDYQDVPLVPKAALLEDAQGSYVYVLRQGSAERVRVTLGPSNDVDVAIAKGLNGGETLCLQGK